MQLLQKDMDGFMAVLNADDMNLRGPSLWVAYKDFAEQDLGKLKAALKNRDPKIVEACKAAGINDTCESGASFRR